MSVAGAEALTFERAARPDAPAAARVTWSRAEIAAAVANIILAVAIVAFFHDRFWWPADDGGYAYVADRLRTGAVLNRDLHDIHGGYVHFVHALALDVFGRDILSLRYPLAFLTVVQSALVFLLLRPLIGAAAICGGLAMAALTFVQFLDPTANWYALFLAVVVAALLAARAHRSFAGLVAIGLTIGMIFFFRQLTGILVGMGTLGWLLANGSDGADAGRPLAARALAATMATGMAAYALLKLEGTAILLYAAWPLAFLFITALHTRLDSQHLTRILLGLLAGALLAAAPLLLYHVLHGSLLAWWRDTTISAIALTDLDFFGSARYLTILLLALRGIVEPVNPASALNGAFWLLLLLSPTILGIVVTRTLLRGAPAHPLAVAALFYGVVSAHYAIPIYALYSAGLTLAGLLMAARSPAARSIAAAATLFAVVVGLTFQAGQPLSRGVMGAIQGTRVVLDAPGIPGASVRMEQRDNAMYLDLLRFIDSHTADDDPILGMPMTPELYFLSGHRPPLRFVIAPLGLLSDEDVAQSWQQLSADMPAVLIFKPDDKYTTPRVRALMDRLRPSYRLCETTGGFELYAPDCMPKPSAAEGLKGS